MIPLVYLHKNNVRIFEEFKFRDSVIRKGDSIRVKFQRGDFIFLRAVYDAGKNLEWFDCKDVSTGKFYSFYMFKLGGLK